MPFCPKCGKEVHDTDVFCKVCGLNLKKQNSSTESLGNQSLESIKQYQSSMLLILLLPAFFFSAIFGFFGLFIMLLICSIAVYSDAKEIGAGSTFSKENMSSITWSPTSWALIVLLFWIIGYPLYLIKRRSIWELNNK